MTRLSTAPVGEIRFTMQHLKNAHRRVGERRDQTLLRFLKTRGVPVKGHVTLRYDEAYQITEHKSGDTYIIRWRKL